MEFFKVHFFQEKTRYKDIEAITAFFEAIEGFEISMSEEMVRYDYTHPRLGYEASFIIMPKSQIEEIHRLNPRYLDLNFHLVLPTLSPDYFADKLFKIAGQLAERFNYYVYQSLFENVLPFKLDLLMKIFNLMKEKHLELNPLLLNNEYYLVSKDKLSSILRYIDDNLELHKHYQELKTYVPLYHCFVNEEYEVKLAIEWNDDTLTVLPPNLDYIFFKRNNETSIIRYDEVVERLSKYLQEVPGFIRNTLVFAEKSQRRVLRTMRRYKFSKVTDRLTKVDIKRLLD